MTILAQHHQRHFATASRIPPQQHPVRHAQKAHAERQEGARFDKIVIVGRDDGFAALHGGGGALFEAVFGEELHLGAQLFETGGDAPGANVAAHRVALALVFLHATLRMDKVRGWLRFAEILEEVDGVGAIQLLTPLFLAAPSSDGIGRRGTGSAASNRTCTHSAVQSHGSLSFATAGFRYHTAVGAQRSGGQSPTAHRVDTAARAVMIFRADAAGDFLFPSRRRKLLLFVQEGVQKGIVLVGVVWWLFDGAFSSDETVTRLQRAPPLNPVGGSLARTVIPKDSAYIVFHHTIHPRAWLFGRRCHGLK